jgi:imidazole glycerol-phosphate synthase subunit HisH
MITIIDYGMGNLGSIANMLKKIGEPSVITSRKEDIEKADKLILPGVGAFDTAMQQIRELDIYSTIQEKALQQKVPLLGICLGMQLLADKSEEGGKEAGLGLIPGTIKKFDTNSTEEAIKIPHMGWNIVTNKKNSPLFKDMFEENKFYFVHSYHYCPAQMQDALLTVNYGYEIVAAVERDNIMGVQFHPEKSHKFGMQLLKNFVKNY